jgi:hypothetical protein
MGRKQPKLDILPPNGYPKIADPTKRGSHAKNKPELVKISIE